jgi:hypothetical protein
LSEKTYYLFDPKSNTLAKFIVRGYSTKPNAKVVLFSSAKKEYIDTANLTEFTLEEARSHWSYLTSRGWYGIYTPQMDYAAQPRRQTLKYALEA